MTEADEVGPLAPLETFDQNAFVGDGKTPQHVCDFVLTLALICNDLRDLIRAQRAIRSMRPAPPVISPRLGEFFGLHAHWIRMLTALLKALAEVVADNQA